MPSASPHRGGPLKEHRDIVRSLETDPRGSRSVHLDFESGDFAGWSVRRLAKDYSAVDPERNRACRHESLPFRDQAGRPRFARTARRIARLVQCPLRRGHLVRLLHLSAEGFRPAAGCRRRAGAMARPGRTRRSLGKTAARYPLPATTDCASPGRFRKWPPKTRTNGMFSMRYRTSRTGRGSISSSGFYWSRKGDSSIDAFLGGQKTVPLRRAARLPQRDKRAVFQARRLCQRANRRPAGRLSRQLQPR